MKNRLLKVSVLMGGDSSEAEISRFSGVAVAEGLRAEGIKVREVEYTPSFMNEIREFQSDVVFVALHGGKGENGDLQQALEGGGLAYTGSGPRASRIAMDKIATKQLLERGGVLTPPYQVICAHDPLDLEALVCPLVIKPPSEGSSIGIEIVKEQGRLESAIEAASRHAAVLLCENFIEGRELTIGIVGKTVLPIVEVVPSTGVYDYECKYTPGKTQYHVPAALSQSVVSRIQSVAQRVHGLVGCFGMSRIDGILAKDEAFYVLEVNTIPGFTKTSLLPKAAAASGISFSKLCLRLVQMAMMRQISS